MDIDSLLPILDSKAEAEEWLRSLAVVDPERGYANLAGMARGMSFDLLAVLYDQLADELPRLSDPDMALNNLERFISQARNPLAVGALFERDATALATLLQIFSNSQYLSDLLVADPASYDLLRLTDGQPVMRDDLVAELAAEVDALDDDRAVMTALRRYKRRETLRIAYGDIVRGQTVATVTKQISYLAQAINEAAVSYARRKLAKKRGVPHGSDGRAARLVVLALGKLGGGELNYSSDIDLVFLYDVSEDADVDDRTMHAYQEFFERLVPEVVRLLTESTDLGAAYRVDLRLRPEGTRGPAVISAENARRYYDVKGRTWERQAYVKARPVAGDLQLGREFLQDLQPWIYRRYLSLADITGIKSLKRRIEQRTVREGANLLNVKTGHGGIRDIEFVIQFLQLLNAGDRPELRSGNTLEAIAQLEQGGCLTNQERTILEENYSVLRKLEHRLQIMFDLQTHMMPDDAEGQRKLAIRMGFVGTPHCSALDAFRTDYGRRTELHRKILDHLPHDAFGDDAETEPEVDLVNDPHPPEAQIEEVLGRFGFRDCKGAYRDLMALADEKIRFLSTRRCRHFLASIAPRLLRAIALTPDPDSTLVNLCQVSDSLGGKAALWELFSVDSSSLNLYVTLCAACPYLAGTLTSNPGMIDELVDSLLLDKLPTLDAQEQSLADLCRGAEDIDPILHSFKDAQHLRVGVRDILGKDDIEESHAALADVAQACLNQITLAEYDRLVEKFGQPTIGDGPRKGQPCEPIVLALGKLGGREPNYHSDLDVVFLYEADGSTVANSRSGRDNTTTNVHFFGELGQRIMTVANRIGPYGRLFEVDPRLRPTGRSGSLAVPIDEFRRYFADGDGQLWERQSLCKGRVIFGSAEATKHTMDTVHNAAYGPPWQTRDAEEIRQMRYRLEESASKRNLKRGVGGTVDVEFIVQMLQLRHGGRLPGIRVPGTFRALAELHRAGLLDDDDFEHLNRGYRFQRNVEARIRLMNAVGRHEVPQDEIELGKLAFLLGHADAAALVDEADEIFCDNRRRFERIFDDAVRNA